VGGELISTLKDGDNQYDVQLRLDTDYRNDPAKLGACSFLPPVAAWCV
jgi:multidrug efflux pump subunit AcrB